VRLISTDDAAWRDLTFVWKGPKDSPFPWEARYQAWAAALVLWPILAFVAYLLLGVMDLLPWHYLIVLTLRALLAIVAGASGAIFLVRRYGQVVTPLRPLGHHLATLMAEVNSPRRRKATTHTLARQPTASRTRTRTVTRGKP